MEQLNKSANTKPDNQTTKESNVSSGILQEISSVNTQEKQENQMQIPQEEEKSGINIINTYCHRIRMKGSNVNISTIKCYKCFKLKTKKNFLSSLGLKSAKMVEVNYLMFFDEIYMYLMKDIIVDKQNMNIRHLGNRYNLYSFINISFDKIEGTKRSKLGIEYNVEAKGSEVLEKEYYFEEAMGNELFKVLEENLLSLGIIAQGNNNEENIENNGNSNINAQEKDQINDIKTDNVREKDDKEVVVAENINEDQKKPDVEQEEKQNDNNIEQISSNEVEHKIKDNKGVQIDKEDEIKINEENNKKLIKEETAENDIDKEQKPKESNEKKEETVIQID